MARVESKGGEKMRLKIQKKMEKQVIKNINESKSKLQIERRHLKRRVKWLFTWTPKEVT